MPVPTVPTFVAGETTTLTGKLGQVSDALNFLLSPPAAYVYKTADGALSSAAWGAINFGAEAYDSHAAHDNVTNNTRLVAPESGLYFCVGHGAFDTNSSGIRGVNIRKNAAGDQTLGTDLEMNIIAGNGTTPTRLIAVVETQLVAGDYIELFCYQNSGGALNVQGGIANTFLSFRWARKTV